MAHDEWALGVVLGFLVKLFDRRHSATLLGDLEAVGDADGIISDRKWTKHFQNKGDPKPSELLEGECITVEEMEEAGIGSFFESQDSNKTGDSELVESHREADEDENHPREGRRPGTSFPQLSDIPKPFEPKIHDIPFSLHDGIVCRNTTVLSAEVHAAVRSALSLNGRSYCLCDASLTQSR